MTFLHHDKMGSIVATSNNSGVVTNKNKFSPFGEIVTLAGTTFGFTGQRYDSELGLVYFKRRYYAPKLGRFIQPDPIGYDSGDFNLYTYVFNSPLKLVDPMGTDGSAGQGGTNGNSGSSGSVGQSGTNGNSSSSGTTLQGGVSVDSYQVGDCVGVEDGSYMVLMKDGEWFNSDSGERYFINDDGDFQLLPDPDAPENQPQDC